ncbi:MAG: hypothetical protein CEN88_67 [Candidatus Berkelbacteria bacterium Licking1014_2]|uniref:Large ribosomal subunit protein uL29 n=1 Tax=Candidatus Berkelbacteria bacterium Licking1014_2 TaxID=2017146 RepID=A0A554LXM3_9BACT|nr:MAG: hypothetical protein CEN88_67 [Candidatus Berkelbacteria bacterium Licking1014_2]
MSQKLTAKEQLEKEIENQRQELVMTRFDLSFNRLKDVSKIKKIKTKIARLLTKLNESS